MLCVILTLVKLASWYKTMYKPLKLSGGAQAARLSPINYRSVLFVHTEGSASEEVREEANGEGQRLPVTLRLTGIQRAAEKGNVEETVVYRKTVHRLISKEEELGAWRDVMEECRFTAEAAKEEEELKDEGMDSSRNGSGYSLILRQNVEQAGGGTEEVDWVIGGWKFKTGEGGEEPVISWGQWLTNYLPRMPWGQDTPPESRAAS